MDVVSGGELFRCLRAGVDPKKIVYAGVGKTAREIADALRAGILMFNVESPAELELIDCTAGGLGLRAPVALRVNPAIDPLTHTYIATGLKESKFGIEAGQILKTYRSALALGHLDVVGIHCHIGSQITQIGPFGGGREDRGPGATGAPRRRAALRRHRRRPRHQLQPGGAPTSTVGGILPASEFDATITEPGRVIAGNAGPCCPRGPATPARRAFSWMRDERLRVRALRLVSPDRPL
jgi:diaminopimelate decarboxylase